MKKRLIVICSILLLACILGSCTNRNPTVQEYFPIQKNIKCNYEGLGNEYAYFNVFIDYASENKVQRRINNGGTESVEVVEVEDGKVTCVFRQAETYYRESYLNKASNVQEVLLMEPIEVGTSWKSSDGSDRTITGVSVNVETPSGNYSTVSVETENEYGRITDYYAKNIGLVKRLSTGKDYEVSSSLSERLENAPFVQTVRFYYPNMNDSMLYYKDKEISFETNDITGKMLEASYKEIFKGQPGDVLSKNTRVNSCYLSENGIVYLDLSKEFLTEMNVGSGYEAMLLQCIANTFGSYYNQRNVYLTIDNALYSSGHIALKEGEYLAANLDGSKEIK